MFFHIGLVIGPRSAVLAFGFKPIQQASDLLLGQCEKHHVMILYTNNNVFFNIIIIQLNPYTFALFVQKTLINMIKVLCATLVWSGIM